jgi:hypothetical protein
MGAHWQRLLLLWHRAVHRDALHLHTEPSCMARLVRGLPGGNQQFAGHATEARASRPLGASFDQQDRIGLGAGGSVGAHAGGTGTHNGDIDSNGRHSWFDPRR